MQKKQVEKKENVFRNNENSQFSSPEENRIY